MLSTFLQMDGGVLLFLQEHVRTPFLNTLMTGITTLGDHGTIWIILTILLLIPKKTRKAGLVSAMALIGSLLFNNLLLKNLVQRPRPYVTFTDLQILIPRPSEFSFPSGHTSSSFAAAAAIYACLSKKYGIPAMILAALIGFSRLYVGVHYPTDVLAGAVIGVLLGYGAKQLEEHVTSVLLKDRGSL